MDETTLHAWIDDRAADHLFSGVAMVWSGGRPVFAHAAGLANRGLGVPVRPDSRFHVASVTKMVTAVAVMRLAAREIFGLHTPLTVILPPELRPAAVTEEHTLHHLLSHRSGLANYHDDDDETWASFTSCWDRIPPHLLRRPSDMLPLFAELPATAPPGAEFSYGDANYVLLGVAIEAATGDTYADVVRREVFEPAGMAASSLTDLDMDPSDLATGYLVTEEPPDQWRSNIYSIPAGGMPDGGLITTAADLCRFIDAFDAGILVDEDARRRMLASYGPVEEGAEDYGYGMETLRVDGDLRIYGHGGSDPGVSTIASRFIAEETTIVVLCNHDRGSWIVSKELADGFDIEDPRS